MWTRRRGRVQMFPASGDRCSGSLKWRNETCGGVEVNGRRNSSRWIEMEGFANAWFSWRRGPGLCSQETSQVSGGRSGAKADTDRTARVQI